MLAIGVFIVCDVGDGVQRVAGEHTLLLLICHFDAVFGQREDAGVLGAGHPRDTPLTL